MSPKLLGIVKVSYGGERNFLSNHPELRDQFGYALQLLPWSNSTRQQLIGNRIQMHELTARMFMLGTTLKLLDPTISKFDQGYPLIRAVHMQANGFTHWMRKRNYLDHWRARGWPL